MPKNILIKKGNILITKYKQIYIYIYILLSGLFSF